jgi:alcohol dehydrogenase
LVAAHQINAGQFVTHRFKMDDIVAAYDTFARAGETGALKVVLTK